MKASFDVPEAVIRREFGNLESLVEAMRHAARLELSYVAFCIDDGIYTLCIMPDGPDDGEERETGAVA